MQREVEQYQRERSLRFILLLPAEHLVIPE